MDGPHARNRESIIISPDLAAATNMRVGRGLGCPAQLSAQVERAVSRAAATGAAARDGVSLFSVAPGTGDGVSFGGHALESQGSCVQA